MLLRPGAAPARTAPVPAASSASAATVDLRSTDSVVAPGRPTDSATPVASVAGTAPVTASAEGTPATALSGGSAAAPEGNFPPDVKPMIPEEHFLERRNLTAEDKAKFFDRMAEQPLFRMCERVLTDVDRWRRAHDSVQGSLTTMRRCKKGAEKQDETTKKEISSLQASLESKERKL